MLKDIPTLFIMQRPNIPKILEFAIFAVFIGLIGISPSLKVIPEILTPMSLHDCQRIIELFFICLLLIESIYNKKNNYLCVSKPVRYGAYTVAILTIISSYLALSVRHALIEISLIAGLCYMAFYIARLYCENSSQLIKRLTYVIWGGILLSMTAFYVGYITAIVFKTPVTWPGPITGFNNIRFFNQYQLWTLGIITLPLLAFYFKNAQMRFWLYLGLIFWWVLLFHSTSRGAVLSWGLGIFITALIYRNLAWPFIRIQLIGITGGLLLYQLLFVLIPFLRNTAVITGTIIRDTISDRLALWSQSLQLIQNHPIFGVGPMNFAWYSPISAHPHNSLLQIMSEWGLPASLVLVAIVFYGIRSWLKKFNMTSLQTQTIYDRSLAIILFFTAVTNATYSLVDGVIVMPISQVMMFTFIGLMLGYYHHKPKSRMVANKSYATSRIFSVIILATLIWSTLPEILQNASGNEKRFSIGYTALGPRLWLEFKD